MTWKNMKDTAKSFISDELKQRFLATHPGDLDYNEIMGFKPGDDGYVEPYPDPAAKYDKPYKPKPSKLIFPTHYNYKEIDVSFNNKIIADINTNKGFCYLFTGPTGRGKSELAKAIYDTIVDALEPMSHAFVSARELWKKYTMIHAGDRQDALEKLTEIEDYSKSNVFFLDELGGEIEVADGLSALKPQNFIAQLIANFYDHWKANRNKPIYSIITTNLDSNNIADKYNERIAERIIEIYKPVPFINQSFRIPQQSIPFKEN